MLGQSRLSQVQTFGGATEMQLPRQDDKVLEPPEIHTTTINIASRDRKESYWTPRGILPHAECRQHAGQL
nr:hypothetical protein GCM10017611_68780 [Rhodococcus wratislaviensis]